MYHRPRPRLLVRVIAGSGPVTGPATECYVRLDMDSALTTSAPYWDRADLTRRVLLAARLTERAVRRSVRPPSARAWPLYPLEHARVMADAALLVRALARPADLDHRIAAAAEGLAQLVPPADSDVLTAEGEHAWPAEVRAVEDPHLFTAVVLRASDAGRLTVTLPRPESDISADADAALAAALAADDGDLSARLLWAWPMLGLRWTPTATFGFTLLADRFDAHGFLPGPSFRTDRLHQFPDDAADAYVLRTSYAPTLAMGVLCAGALGRTGRRSPGELRSHRTSAYHRLPTRLLTDDHRPCAG